MRGRIRSIKPEVGCDEELWDLEQETGLPLYRAYTMLWCYSDREGRFEWRPRALKVKVLPYSAGDFEGVLAALERGRFIVRYEIDGKAYGWVRTFAKHQAINGKELPSVLPAPPPVSPRVPHACTTRPEPSRGEGNGNGTERKGSSGAREDAPDAPDAAAPESSVTQLPDVLRELPSDLGPILPELYARAAESGLSREHVDARLEKLRTGPIGGNRGVLRKRLKPYLLGLIAGWRTQSERDAFVARSGPGLAKAYPGSPANEVERWVPDSRHRTLAAELGESDFEQALGEYRSKHMPRGKPHGEVDKHFATWLRRRTREVA